MRTQKVRNQISLWIDTLKPGDEINTHSLGVQYNRNGISIGNILKEWHGDRIKLVKKACMNRFGPSGSIWVKI